MNYILSVNFGIRTNWTPHSCPSRSSRYLRGWLIGTHKFTLFAVPKVWREMKGHLTDWYLYLTKIDDHTSKAKYTTLYPSFPSAPRPLENDDSLSMPKRFKNGPCMKKEHPAAFQKTNLDLHVPVWILTSRN